MCVILYERACINQEAAERESTSTARYGDLDREDTQVGVIFPLPLFETGGCLLYPLEEEIVRNWRKNQSCTNLLAVVNG